MTDTKPWYLSKTIWGALVTVGASLAGLAGAHVDAGQQSTIADAAFQMASTVGGVIAIFGRLGASTKVS